MVFIHIKKKYQCLPFCYPSSLLRQRAHDPYRPKQTRFALIRLTLFSAALSGNERSSPKGHTENNAERLV
jgi:hypothetical protein